VWRGCCSNTVNRYSLRDAFIRSEAFTVVKCQTTALLVCKPWVAFPYLLPSLFKVNEPMTLLELRSEHAYSRVKEPLHYHLDTPNFFLQSRELGAGFVFHVFHGNSNWWKPQRSEMSEWFIFCDVTKYRLFQIRRSRRFSERNLIRSVECFPRTWFLSCLTVKRPTLPAVSVRCMAFTTLSSIRSVA
jgi:hypothetical protein